MIPSAIGLLLMAGGLVLVYLAVHRGDADFLPVLPQQPLTARPDLSAPSGHTPVQ